MGAYNWIVALMCLAFFGLLYACAYDVMEDGFAQAYTDTDEAQTAVDIIHTVWRFLPLGCTASMILYLYNAGQKEG